MRARQFVWMVLLAIPVLSSCRKNKTLQQVVVPEIPGTDTIGNPNEIPSDTVSYSAMPVYGNIGSNIGGYYEFLPPAYDSTLNNHPLLVFLHGGGERGDGSPGELPKVLVHSVAKRAHEKSLPVTFSSGAQSFSFVIVCPQFRDWPGVEDVDLVIRKAIEKYRIDTSRIYIAGLSMGGGVAWEYAGSRFGRKVAAVVPICGASWADSAVAKNIAANQVPAWAFHNEDDEVVTVNSTKRYVRLVNNENPPVPVKVTYWPTGGHDAWTKASDPEYREDGKNIYEWLLQYVR